MKIKRREILYQNIHGDFPPSDLIVRVTESLAATPVTQVFVGHDSWCAYLKRGTACNCNPEITVK